MTDGERWAREALAALRDARFAPRASWTFLAVSFARARALRQTHPRAHRQALLLAAAGATAWVGVAVTGRPALAAAGGSWWLLTVAMLDWHLGMLEHRDGRPRDGIGTANVLTLLRIGAVPALPALGARELGGALLLAAASDLVDGTLARRSGELTRLGPWLDSAADSFVRGVAAVALARLGLLPWWAAGVVAGGYALGWLVLATGYFALARPPLSGKIAASRIPGGLLALGLVLAAFGVPGAEEVALAGPITGALLLVPSLGRRLRRRRYATAGPPGGASCSTSARPSGKSCEAACCRARLIDG